jgi:hypothetical protein
MKTYTTGKNSRGIPTDRDRSDEPKISAAVGSLDNNFIKLCEVATDRINLLIEQGVLPRNFWNKGGTSNAQKSKKAKNKASFSAVECVEATPRQYRRYRQGHGLAFKYGKKK